MFVKKINYMYIIITLLLCIDSYYLMDKNNDNHFVIDYKNSSNKLGMHIIFSDGKFLDLSKVDFSKVIVIKGNKNIQPDIVNYGECGDLMRFDIKGNYIIKIDDSTVVINNQDIFINNTPYLNHHSAILYSNKSVVWDKTIEPGFELTQKEIKDMQKSKVPTPLKKECL